MGKDERVSGGEIPAVRTLGKGRTAVRLVELGHDGSLGRLGHFAGRDALELDELQQAAADLGRMRVVVLLFVGRELEEEALRDDVLSVVESASYGQSGKVEEGSLRQGPTSMPIRRRPSPSKMRHLSSAAWSAKASATSSATAELLGRTGASRGRGGCRRARQRRAGWHLHYKSGMPGAPGGRLQKGQGSHGEWDGRRRAGWRPGGWTHA